MINPTLPSLSSFDIRNILRLLRSENVGIITFFDLLKRYKTPEKALDVLPEMAARGGKKTYKIPPLSQIERELEETEKFGARPVVFGSNDYPELLGNIYDPPPVLFTHGYTHLLKKTSVAIVGARNASLNGKNFTRKICEEIGAKGLVIISGLARGIDTEAHKASLNSGTIAVIAGGINNIYPPENKDLYAEIRERGVIITEQAFGVSPVANSFPKRNRIISGISSAVAIIEASLNSGSLITARMALEHGREIFAVPGSPMDVRCKGTNKLIRNGASLLESSSDIIDYLNSRPKTGDGFYSPKRGQLDFLNFAEYSPEENELSSARKLIIENLSAAPVHIDSLIQNLAISPQVAQIAILELELAGKIERSTNGKISLLF